MARLVDIWVWRGKQLRIKWEAGRRSYGKRHAKGTGWCLVGTKARDVGRRKVELKTTKAKRVLNIAGLKGGGRNYPGKASSVMKGLKKAIRYWGVHGDGGKNTKGSGRGTPPNDKQRDINSSFREGVAKILLSQYFVPTLSPPKKKRENTLRSTATPCPVSPGLSRK